MTDMPDDRAGAPGAREQVPAPELQDIRTLAEATKQRISQRMVAQGDAEERVRAATSLAMRTISLPDLEVDARAAHAAAPGPAVRRDRGGVPAWVYATVSAAAAAAIVYVLIGRAEPTVIRVEVPVASPALAQAPEAPRQQIEPMDTPAPQAAAQAEPIAAQAGDTASESEARQTSTRPRAGQTAAARAPDDRPAQAAGEARAAAAEPGEQAGATPKKEAPKKADAIDDLLSQASGGAADPVETRAAAQEAKPVRTRLERSDIQKAMEPIHAKAQACFDTYRVPGSVMIRFNVEPSGAISSARALPPFQDTDTGTCVVAALKTATLPSYSGAPMTFTYPFLLTQ